MVFTQILTVASIIATVIVGFILNKRIQHQKGMLDDMKTYHSIIDIKKINEFVELRKDADIARMELEAHLIMAKQQIEIGQQFDEMFSFIYNIIEAFPEKTRRELIQRDMPHCEYIFDEFFSDSSKT
jgi:hypothetical protein